MALTLTWSISSYEAENAGKGYVGRVNYDCAGVDGDAVYSYTSTVKLDRPSDSDMEAKETFATKEKLLAAVKAQIGDSVISGVEEIVTDRVAEIKGPQREWHSFS